MKPEKMTEESRESALRRSVSRLAECPAAEREACWTVAVVAVNDYVTEVDARIAALMAERAEVVADNAALAPLTVHSSECREAEGPDCACAIGASPHPGATILAERDALRERVQALEAAATAVDAWLYNSGSAPNFTCSGPVLCGRCRGCTTAALHKVVSGSGTTPPTREDVLEAELGDAQSDARKLEAEVVRLQDEVRASNSADWAFDAAKFARNERDALRERVRTLEDEVKRAQAESLALQMGKDALRERVQALEAAARHALEWERVSREDPDRPMLQPWDALRRALSKDATEAPQTDDLAAIEQYRENEEAKHEHRYRADGSCACGAMVHEAPEPTTAEAFATVREALTTLREDKYPVTAMASGKALSLLERRLGATDAAARTALRVAELGSSMTSGQISALRLALAGAPPVFTLEEVREAMLTDGVDVDTVQQTCVSLAALRKVSP